MGSVIGIAIIILVLCILLFYLIPLYSEYLGKRFAAGAFQEIKGRLDFSLKSLQIIKGEQHGEKN